MLNRNAFIFLLVLGAFTWTGCGKNLAPSNPNSGGTPAFAFQFNYGDEGFAGSGNGQFYEPFGVAVYNNWLFVVDFGNGGNGGRVQKFDLNGNFLGAYTGNPAKHLYGPEGLAIDKNGILYVCDFGNAQIQELDVNGNYLATLGSGTADAVLGDFDQPLGIAVDNQSNIYVADHGNNRLEKCGPTGSGCVTVGSYTYVVGVAVDGAGNVWVTDTTANKVYEYSSALSLLNTYGTTGSAPGDINGPRGIAAGTDGNLVVTDAGNARVERFDPSWNYLGMVGIQGPGTNPGQFSVPNFVAVSGSDVYVSDFQNQVVMKF